MSPDPEIGCRAPGDPSADTRLDYEVGQTTQQHGRERSRSFGPEVSTVAQIAAGGPGGGRSDQSGLAQISFDTLPLDLVEQVFFVGYEIDEKLDVLVYLPFRFMAE